jgi:hypothetical protein
MDQTQHFNVNSICPEVPPLNMIRSQSMNDQLMKPISGSTRVVDENNNSLLLPTSLSARLTFCVAEQHMIIPLQTFTAVKKLLDHRDTDLSADL